jgi:hypothetical protein
LNLKKTINHTLLGPQCRVEYENHNRSNRVLIEDQLHTNIPIVLAKIPENVTKNVLYNLLGECYIDRFAPATRVYRSSTAIEPVKMKIFTA